MKKNQNKSNDELRFENELRKLKINLQSGANFYPDSEMPDLPPEVEKQFLDNVEAFEKALNNAEQISVFEFLGRPKFIPEADMGNEELKNELDRLTEIMFENCMTVNVIYEVDDRTFYKFITQELFNVQTMNVKIPQFIKHFIYEEFYPNHQEEIKEMCCNLLERFSENDLPDDYSKEQTKIIVNYNELRVFRNSLNSVNNLEIEFDSAEISGHLASIKLNVAFDGEVCEGTAPIHYKGISNFKLEFDDNINCWGITRLHIPGMRNIESGQVGS